MMKVWGMLSPEDEKSGFDLVLDENWYVVLLEHGQTVARFDPRDYTSTELLIELEAVLQDRRDIRQEKTPARHAKSGA